MELAIAKRAFFVPFILSEGNFFNICVLPRCIVYWIQFQNIDTFIYQKTLLLLKIVESLQCIPKNKYAFTSYQKTLFHIDYQSSSINQNNISPSTICYYVKDTLYHKMGVTLDLFLVYFMTSYLTATTQPLDTWNIWHMCPHSLN